MSGLINIGGSLTLSTLSGRSIALADSTGVPIKNEQGVSASNLQKLTEKVISEKHSFVVKRRGPSYLFNCHGLTFASRRTRIEESGEVEKILKNDKWVFVEEATAMPGDIVVYSDDLGEINHTGVVVEVLNDIMMMIKVCSKWGEMGEYIHRVNDVPDGYGPNKSFYRSHL